MTSADSWGAGLVPPNALLRRWSPPTFAPFPLPRARIRPFGRPGHGPWPRLATVEAAPNRALSPGQHVPLGTEARRWTEKGWIPGAGRRCDDSDVHVKRRTAFAAVPTFQLVRHVDGFLACLGVGLMVKSRPPKDMVHQRLMLCEDADNEVARAIAAGVGAGVPAETGGYQPPRICPPPRPGQD